MYQFPDPPEAEFRPFLAIWFRRRNWVIPTPEPELTKKAKKKTQKKRKKTLVTSGICSFFFHSMKMQKTSVICLCFSVVNVRVFLHLFVFFTFIWILHIRPDFGRISAGFRPVMLLVRIYIQFRHTPT